MCMYVSNWVSECECVCEWVCVSECVWVSVCVSGCASVFHTTTNHINTSITTISDCIWLRCHIPHIPTICKVVRRWIVVVVVVVIYRKCSGLRVVARCIVIHRIIVELSLQKKRQKCMISILRGKRARDRVWGVRC